MALLDILDELVATTEAALLALWARVEDGTLEEAAFLTMAAHIINAANARATVAADMAITAELRSQGRFVRPTGIRPLYEPDRIRQGLQTLLVDDKYLPVNAFKFIAQSEPVGRAQVVANKAMERHKVGWVRGLSGGACPLCTNWADGKVRPPRVTMIRHHGCRCMPRPVVREQ